MFVVKLNIVTVIIGFLVSSMRSKVIKHQTCQERHFRIVIRDLCCVITDCPAVRVSNSTARQKCGGSRIIFLQPDCGRPHYSTFMTVTVVILACICFVFNALTSSFKAWYELLAVLNTWRTWRWAVTPCKMNFWFFCCAWLYKVNVMPCFKRFTLSMKINDPRLDV